MPLDEDIEVSLLIGLNCTHAIKPLEVIPGKQDDPYANKTDLGWGIIGAVRSSNEEEPETKSDIACNRIVTCEVQGTPKRKMVHFAFKTQVKEMISLSDVSKMFTLDFNERPADEKPLLGIAREGIHQSADGRFEMPLPLQNKNLNDQVLRILDNVGHDGNFFSSVGIKNLPNLSKFSDRLAY